MAGRGSVPDRPSRPDAGESAGPTGPHQGAPDLRGHLRAEQLDVVQDLLVWQRANAGVQHEPIEPEGVADVGHLFGDIVRRADEQRTLLRAQAVETGRGSSAEPRSRPMMLMARAYGS